MDRGTEWLWPGWVPRGQLSMLKGPGPETSLVATWLVTTVLRGGSFPDGTRIEPVRQRIMWLDARGDYVGLQERLVGLGCPTAPIIWPRDPAHPQRLYPSVDLSLDPWLNAVAEAAAQHRPAWVVVNGLDFGRGDVDAWLDRALEVLAGVARARACAVTLVLEVPDPPPRGFAAIAATAATILELKPRDSTTGEVQLRAVKTIGAHPAPLLLRLDSGGPEVVSKPASTPTSAPSLERAVAFLERELAGGPRLAVEAMDSALKSGLSARSVQRAKRQLAVTTFFSQKRWWWSLS